MRILMAHNRYLIRGGEDQSVESEISMLKENGHDVTFFECDNKLVKRIGLLRTSLRTIWSQETYLEVRKILRENSHDVVHVQNFFPLISPSIFYAAKAENVPVVQSIRNYRITCPGGLLLRDGKICEDCLGRAFAYPGVMNGCYKDSKVGSGVVASMSFFHRLAGTWSGKIDRFIALTEFVRQKCIEGGIPQELICVKPNFVSPDPGFSDHERHYFLYVGRLSSEKGIDLLVEAWLRRNIQIPLKIVGRGPLFEQLSKDAESSPWIEIVGPKTFNEVMDSMAQAKAILFPSRWYETFGRTIVESFSTGTPVIASNLGGVPELVSHGETGLLFLPNDSDDLAEKVIWALENPLEMVRMGKNGRKEYEKFYMADANYEKLMHIYEEAIIHNRMMKA